MKLIFFISTCLLCLSVNARDFDGENKNLKNSSRENRRDSILPAGPNELYLNIGPSLSVLQGAWATNETNLTFMYKRSIHKSRFAYRIGVGYKAEVQRGDQLYENSVSTPNSGIWYFDVTDSTRIKKIMVNNPVKKIQLNFGIERRSKWIRRWTGFTGLDFVAGIYRHDAELYKIRQSADMSGNWYDERSDTARLMKDYRRATGYYFGISPKAGLSYAFNPHWLLSAQIAVLATFDMGEYFAWDSGTDKIYELKSNTFNFNINGIIDELNLVYRF
jgi:hypothetical protein